MFLGGMGAPSPEPGRQKEDEILEQLKKMNEKAGEGGIRTGDSNFPTEVAQVGEGGALPSRDFAPPAEGDGFFGPGASGGKKEKGVEAQIKTAERLEEVRHDIKNIADQKTPPEKINEGPGDKDVVESLFQ